jgi:hypothetical protein
MSRLKVTGKALLIGYGVLVFMGLLFLFIRSIDSGSTPEQSPTTSEEESVPTGSVESYLESGSIVLKNSSSLGSLVSKERLDRTQNILYVKIANSISKPNSQYDGIIREGSIKSSTTASGTPRVEFLVDIATLKRTYRVSINGTEDSEYQAIYVLCPTTAELIYPAFKCSDG